MLYDVKTHNWRELVDMYFLEDPVWAPDSRFIQFLGVPWRGARALFRLNLSSGKFAQVVDLTQIPSPGEHWEGIAPDGMPLVFRGALASQVYALDFE